MKAHNVYHFTCTARLPWIIATRELQSYRDPISDFPNPDFVWATTRHQGDRTAAGMKGYRSGATALVRLTLSAGDFELWPEITNRFPQWKPDHIRRLEAAARSMGETNTASWRARAEPLPISRIIEAEAKSYTGRWRAVELHDFLQHPSDPAVRGVVVNEVVYYAAQYIAAGHTGYAPGKISLADWKREARSCSLASLS
jgi:hypothetical protein